MEMSVCKGCGRTTYIQNRTKWLCPECVYKRNHGGKSRVEVALEKRRKKTNVRKATGEKEMFLKIWSERPHQCVNCGKYLGEVPKSFMFSQREAKSVNEQERLNPSNIDLLCFDCHFARDMQSKVVFEKLKLKI